MPYIHGLKRHWREITIITTILERSPLVADGRQVRRRRPVRVPDQRCLFRSFRRDRRRECLVSKSVRR